MWSLRRLGGSSPLCEKSYTKPLKLRPCTHNRQTLYQNLPQIILWRHLVRPWVALGPQPFWIPKCCSWPGVLKARTMKVSPKTKYKRLKNVTRASHEFVFLFTHLCIFSVTCVVTLVVTLLPLVRHKKNTTRANTSVACVLSHLLSLVCHMCVTCLPHVCHIVGTALKTRFHVFWGSVFCVTFNTLALTNKVIEHLSFFKRFVQTPETICESLGPPF